MVESAFNKIQDGNRRDFLRTAAVTGAAVMLGGLGEGGCQPVTRASKNPVFCAPILPIRVGFVGVGGRGFSLLNILVNLEGVEVRAVCDLVEQKVQRAQDCVEKANQPRPKGFSRGGYDFRRMCQEDLDLVITATPWEWHTPVCVAAMNAGKHAATEVPAAVSVEECWQLVDTSESTRRYCAILENCCYFRNVMTILNMVRRGMFGELVHCEAGYQHDTRFLAYRSKTGELTWRGLEALNHDGNMYPTHPLGPVAQWMNVNRGDRFDYLVSMSSKAVGMKTYIQDHLGPDHPLAQKPWKQGDINTTLIRTVNGQTITLYFDVQLPRPYDLIYRVQGTRGIYMGTLNQIMLQKPGQPAGEAWGPMASYEKEYDHPLWSGLEQNAKDAGHGGADYIMLYRLIKTLQRGEPVDMDAYDAAAWSAVVELSQRSVAKNTQPMRVPDFTRGQWKIRAPLGVVQP